MGEVKDIQRNKMFPDGEKQVPCWAFSVIQPERVCSWWFWWGWWGLRVQHIWVTQSCDQSPPHSTSTVVQHPVSSRLPTLLKSRVPSLSTRLPGQPQSPFPSFLWTSGSSRSQGNHKKQRTGTQMHSPWQSFPILLFLTMPAHLHLSKSPGKKQAWILC